MSALAMISGKIHRGPDVRTGKSGKPYTALTIKIAVGGAAEFWSCIVFSEARNVSLNRSVQATASVSSERWKQSYTRRTAPRASP